MSEIEFIIQVGKKLYLENVLKTVSEENDVEYISVNCMDIINGYSVIVTGNEKTAEIISNAIGIQFKGLKARTNELVSRKEIVKVMRNLYKRGKN